MNKLEKVLEVLGLEINREYYLEVNGVIIEKVKINNYVTIVRHNKSKGCWERSDKQLMDIISQPYTELIPVPFVPKDGEEYWTINCNTADSFHFDNNSWHDVFRLATGFCFRTEEEAEENKDKFLKLMQDIREGSKLVLEKPKKNKPRKISNNKVTNKQ